MKTIAFPAALAVCLLAWLLPTVGVSATTVDLYSAEAAVEGEDADERNRAISAAFGAVLVKLTGDRMVETRSGAAELLARAPTLVQQYRYRTGEISGDEPPQRYLWVRFDDGAVDRLLAERAWPVWRAPRPRLLVWLALDEGGRRGLVNYETQRDGIAALRARAAVRGIAVQLPLLDLEDQTRLTAADLWSGFAEPIQAAAQRYGEGPVLVGRLKFLGQGRWQPDWLLYDSAGAQGFSGAPGGFADALAAGMDVAADRLAARYAPALAVSGPAPVRVVVGGVRDLADYAAVLEVMGRAGGVNRLSLRGVERDALVFDVWLDGGAEALAAELGDEWRLRAQPAVLDETGQRRVEYLWSP